MVQDGSERDKKILASLKDSSTLDQAARTSGLPRSTLHRRLRRLFERGLVRHEGETYTSTEAGLKLLGGQAEDIGQDPLALKLPFLSILPSPLHRALATLVLFARVVRRENVSEDRNSAFILVGPTQRLKSWLIKALCLLTGSSLDRSRVPMMSVRSRGLLIRLNGKGERTYENQALKEPLLWAEELSLADATTKRDVESLIHGQKDVRVENEVVRVEAVPIFELNPRVREGTLEQRIGLDPPRIRRSIIADFAAVTLTPRQRAESPALLERIKKYAPLALPQAKRKLDPRCQALVDHAVNECVLPEAMDFIDPSRILTLVQGASGILPDVEAASTVLRACFTVYESTRFVRADWRERLSKLKPDQVLDMIPSTPQGEMTIIAPVVATAEIPKPVIAYDLEGVLLRIKQDVETSGFVLPEDEPEVRALLQISKRLKDERISPQEFIGVAAKVGRLIDLQGEIENLGGTEARIREMKAILDGLDGFGVGGKAVLALAEALLDSGHQPDTKKAAENLLEVAQRGLSIDQEVSALVAKKERLEVERENLIEEIGQLKASRRKQRSLLKLALFYIERLPALQAAAEKAVTDLEKGQ